MNYTVSINDHLDINSMIFHFPPNKPGEKLKTSEKSQKCKRSEQNQDIDDCGEDNISNYSVWSYTNDVDC